MMKALSTSTMAAVKKKGVDEKSKVKILQLSIFFVPIVFAHPMFDSAKLCNFFSHTRPLISKVNLYVEPSQLNYQTCKDRNLGMNLSFKFIQKTQTSYVTYLLPLTFICDYCNKFKITFLTQQSTYFKNKENTKPLFKYDCQAP